MRIYVRSGDLPRYLSTLSDRLARNLEDADAATLTDALADAEALSQGTFSTVQLAQMGHPYAKRDPRPPADPAIINRQTGRFAASWHTEAPAEGSGAAGDSIEGKLVNDAPEAADLDQGTDKMIARPLTTRVLESIRDRRLARVKEAIRQTLAGR